MHAMFGLDSTDLVDGAPDIDVLLERMWLFNHTYTIPHNEAEEELPLW